MGPCDITDLPVQLLDVSKSVSKSSGINFEDWSGKPDDANKKKVQKKTYLEQHLYCNIAIVNILYIHERYSISLNNAR